MQKYKCHKEVEAFQVHEVRRFTRLNDCSDPSEGEESWVELLGEPGDRAIVSDVYMSKHTVKLGGYYVRYADGYESFSPADAFEGGYTAIPA